MRVVALQPIDGRIVAPDHAAAVVAPPYDVLTEAQRAELATGAPDSFLSVLPTGPPTPEGLDANLEALTRLVETGRFVPVERPFVGVLSLTAGGARTLAVIGDIEVEAYLDGRVLPHEHVTVDRVAQLVGHLDVVGIASSPVCVVHRPTAEVTRLTEQVLTDDPVVAFDAADGVEVALYLVTDPARQHGLSAAIDAAGTLFVADGHHRAAAVAQHGAATVLTAVVPSDQLRVLAFHRRVDGLGDATAARVLAAFEDLGLSPEPLPSAFAPAAPGIVHVTVEGRWWAIDLRDRRAEGPVESLDVRLLERELLDPLGWSGAAAARDGGVEVTAVPGPVGLDALVRPGSVGLALHPPRIEDVLAVAEAGAVMPAKSTYLTPKLRSGLVVVSR
jgi:uncharacterized protein (DUF1015 family)